MNDKELIIAIGLLGLFGLLGFLAYLYRREAPEPEALEVIETPGGWIIEETSPRKLKIPSRRLRLVEETAG